jgi:DNA primase
MTQHLFETVLPDGVAGTFEAKMEALERLRPITAVIPVGLTRSAFFGAMARHFGLPAVELEAQLKTKAPAVVKAAPRPVAPAGPREPPPDQLEGTYGACIIRTRSLLNADKLRVFDELKHPGIRTLVAAIQSGQGASDVLYEADEGLKQSLQKCKDLLPADDGALEQAFLVVCRRLKLRALEDQLQRIARLSANAAGGSSELTQESRDLLEERGALLNLKRELLSQKG